MGCYNDPWFYRSSWDELTIRSGGGGVTLCHRAKKLRAEPFICFTSCCLLLVSDPTLASIRLWAIISEPFQAAVRHGSGKRHPAASLWLLLRAVNGNSNIPHSCSHRRGPVACGREVSEAGRFPVVTFFCRRWQQNVNAISVKHQTGIKSINFLNNLLILYIIQI